MYLHLWKENGNWIYPGGSKHVWHISGNLVCDCMCTAVHMPRKEIKTPSSLTSSRILGISKESKGLPCCRQFLEGQGMPPKTEGHLEKPEGLIGRRSSLSIYLLMLKVTEKTMTEKPQTLPPNSRAITKQRKTADTKQTLWGNNRLFSQWYWVVTCKQLRLHL